MKEWQLCNIKSFGIDLPMEKEYWLPAHTIQELFDVVAAKDVNPQAIQPEGNLGYQWYEWLAEAGMGIEPETRGFLFAARHFSWDYPQLKMVIHQVRVLKAVEDREHFLDGVHFMVEFYS